MWQAAVDNLTGVIPDSTTGNYAPSATSIYATGSDVYVAGNQYLNLNPQVSQALYWKNGKMTRLGSNGEVTGIAAK
jgi:hypothetical protein